MIITKDQYKDYIKEGVILKRTVDNVFGHYESIIEVLSIPYTVHESRGTFIKFKYIAIKNDLPMEGVREYYLNDLFNGTVEVLEPSVESFLSENDYIV